MSKISVFLLQDSKEVNDELERKFLENDKFEIVGKGCDGISAISLIADKKPDVVILELVLAGYDGLCVIQKLKEMGSKSKIIVLSAISREQVVSKSIALGAEYFMAKPYDFELLKERVIEILSSTESTGAKGDYVRPFHEITLEEKISRIFINVGIPPHIKGYAFLREGVKMAVNQPQIINSITKELYPRIGERYNTTPSKVERAIRHAIEVAWNRGRIDTINNILGVRAYVGAEKPTNGEFIALVADKMILEKA